MTAKKDTKANKFELGELNLNKKFEHLPHDGLF